MSDPIGGNFLSLTDGFSFDSDQSYYRSVGVHMFDLEAIPYMEEGRRLDANGALVRATAEGSDQDEEVTLGEMNQILTELLGEDMLELLGEENRGYFVQGVLELYNNGEIFQGETISDADIETLHDLMSGFLPDDFQDVLTVAVDL